jgi:pimeloyl-ACP methyl ester carboxylesterase
VHIAYQVFGEGELDLVLVPGFVTHVELLWEAEPSARFLEALGSFARVINFDRRGSGLSDPVPGAPTLEERMDDVRAVMDAAGSERAVLMGISEGVPMSILFAATYPERVRALVCYGGMARSTEADDYPFAPPAEALVESGFDFVLPYWGQGTVIEVSSPSLADDPDARAFAGRMERATASPGMLASLAQMFIEIDVRDVVPTVQAPTLVVHRRFDRLVNVRHSRWLDEHLPDAKLVELPGGDHLPWGEGADDLIGEVQAFLTGTHYSPEPDRILATVLFTDIVDSTGTAAQLGDHGWREVLESHRRGVRDELARFGGREVKTLGDGFLISFDGPARGIRCARAIIDSSEQLGVRVRAGMHTGECEVMGDDLGGMAIHIAARVSALAEPSEVLVSRTVKDLVVGSGIEFTARGVHELNGVPDAWDLHSANA